MAPYAAWHVLTGFVHRSRSLVGHHVYAEGRLLSPLHLRKAPRSPLSPTSSRGQERIMMSPTAEPIHDTHIDVHLAHVVPLHPQRHSDRAQTARMDAVAARILAGYQVIGTTWLALPPARWPPSPYLRSRAADSEGQAWMDAHRFFERNIMYENE